jgi:hypothetical protein
MSWTFTLGAHADSATPPAHAHARDRTLKDAGRMTARFGREGVVRWIAIRRSAIALPSRMLGGPARGVDDTSCDDLRRRSCRPRMAR